MKKVIMVMMGIFLVCGYAQSKETVKTEQDDVAAEAKLTTNRIYTQWNGSSWDIVATFPPESTLTVYCEAPGMTGTPYSFPKGLSRVTTSATTPDFGVNMISPETDHKYYYSPW